ncbi:MAG: hypothetical protein HGA45_10205 [Chloroflexales bacterium]|nr:hypothetical protein [Chloroflexales bacterium]
MRRMVVVLILVTAALLAHTPAGAQQAGPTPTPMPFLDGEPAPRLAGDLAMRTYSLDLYRSEGGLSVASVKGLAMAAEESLQRGGKVVGGYLTGRVAISFEPPQTGPCALRGITLSNQRTIRLFYGPVTDSGRVSSILAHELFHQIQHDYYGERDHRKADVILLEGMAAWGTADYFRTVDGEPQYRANVRAAQRAGELLPLTTSLERDCRTTTRSVIYDQWASFVEYLVVTYGRDRLDAAYRSSSGRPAGSSDYRAVYGKPLSQVEREWRVWVVGQ